MTQGLLNYLINAAWQAPLLVLGALALVRLGRFGPRAANAVWMACLALTIILPAVRCDLAGLLPQAAPVVIAEAAAPAAPDLAPAPIADAVATPAPAPWVGLALDGSLAELLIGAFAGAMVIGLVRLGLGWRDVRRLAREAEEVAAPAWLALEMASVAAAHGARPPRIGEHPDLSGPVVVGALNPRILVPAGFFARPEGELRPALLHELAHVVRRDYAANLAAELISLPLCWHPAVYVIKAQVRRSRELACDAMASTAMRSQTAYARGLVALAQALKAATIHSATPDTPAIAVGLFGKPLLEERLMHLIGPKRALHPALKTAGLAGGALLAAGAAGAAVLFHVSAALAQPVPPVPPAPPALRSAPPAPPALPAPPEAPPAPPAPAMAAEAPQAPEPPAPPPAPHMGPGDHRTIVISENHGAYTHHWTAGDGTSVTVRNNNPKAPSAEERARIEKSYAEDMAGAREAQAMVDSPDFKKKIVLIHRQAAEARLAALRALDDPKIKAELAQARRMVIQSADAERQAQAEVARVMADPKIKAELAEARRVAAESGEQARQIRLEVRRMVGDPKMKRRVIEIVRTDGPDDAGAERVVRETTETADHDAGRRVAAHRLATAPWLI